MNILAFILPFLDILRILLVVAESFNLKILAQSA